ncbi:uncharacterized protein LOC143292002 [Babylonia areolata]|uniref:uncharacterized protein LOC143292002 n=1 Tax=Babylonia areolata TaxID=304850 RepID=UPI003FD112AB
MEPQVTSDAGAGGENGGQSVAGNVMAKSLKKGRKKSEDEDGKKTQAQRLLEFEMWTDGQALRDMEYSQRRTEKKQRREERKKEAHNHRRWKRLYLPSVLIMLTGTILTLCGTMRSMSGDTILWEARGVLIIVGPVVLGLGFICLMLAAGCTFQHDQEIKQERDPFSEFLLQGFVDRTHSSVTRTLTPRALRSISNDTTDLPIPEDLDPQKNYVLAKPGWTADRGVGRRGSTLSTVSLEASNSYVSTASWVRSVSASHSPQTSMTRQNSDINLLAGRCTRNVAARRSLLLDYSEVRDPAGSHADLHVVCTRSLTSSGYQSAGDSTTGPVDYQVSKENNIVGVVFSSAPLRHASHRMTSGDITTKTVTRTSNLSRVRNHSTVSQGQQRTAMDTRLHSGQAQPRGLRGRKNSLTASLPTTPLNMKSSGSSGGSSAQGRRKTVLNANRNDTSPRMRASHASYAESLDVTRTKCLSPGTEDRYNVVPGDGVPSTVKHPVALEPIVYTVGSVRCTDV